MSGRSAKRQRSWVPVLLAGFLLVSAGVIWRRVSGIDNARQLRDLERQRDALVAEKARLEGAISRASSRARLAPIAEQRLGMRVPAASEVILLPRHTTPASPSSGGTAGARP